jgi:hypothetical protein
MAQTTLEAGAGAGAGAGDLDQLNGRLAEISLALYEGRATLRIVDPKSIVLLKRNARYMKKAMFEQLTKNIGDDGMLSSVPLCHEKQNGEEPELECLSGNHRIQAAVKAGLTRVLVLVIANQDQDGKIARQLSHNALVGEDDRQILADLWRDLSDIRSKLYSGLDSKLIAELEKIRFTGFTAQPLRTEQIALWFLPEEVQSIDELLGESLKVAAADATYIAPLAKYALLFDSLVRTKTKHNIKNTAVAFMWLIDRMAEVLMEIEGKRVGSIESDASADQAEEGAASAPPRSPV